jgi:hypothetical protein
MATRSIKLKLAVGPLKKKPADDPENKRREQLRQAIWTTHKVFNEGVRYYMQWLMRMRQRPFRKKQHEDEDDEIVGLSAGQDYFFHEAALKEELLCKTGAEEKGGANFDRPAVLELLGKFYGVIVDLGGREKKQNAKKKSKKKGRGKSAEHVVVDTSADEPDALEVSEVNDDDRDAVSAQKAASLAGSYLGILTKAKKPISPAKESESTKAKDAGDASRIAMEKAPPWARSWLEEPKKKKKILTDSLQEILKWGLETNVDYVKKSAKWLGPLNEWMTTNQKDGQDEVPRWVDGYLKWLKTQKKKNDEFGPIKAELCQRNLTPLFPKFTESAHVDVKGNAKLLDKACLAEAIVRMGQFEINSIKVSSRKNDLDQAKDKLAKEREEIPEIIRNLLQKYEKERTYDLGRESLEPRDQYRIMPSGSRRFKEIVAAWKDRLETNGTASDDELKAIVGKLHGKFRKRGFGDPKLFRALVEQPFRPVWQDGPAHLNKWAEANDAERDASRAKERPRLTLPDPVHRPVWMRYEGAGGSNLGCVWFKREGEGTTARTFICCDLIEPDDPNKPDGPYHVRGTDGQKTRKKAKPKPNSTDTVIPLRSTEQIELTNIGSLAKTIRNADGKKKWAYQKLEMRDLSTREELKGELKGSQIIFGEKGPCLESFVEKGTPKCFLSAVVDVAPKTLQQNYAEPVQPFKFKNRKPIGWNADFLQEGRRVLSLDLGIRQFAAYSVFVLTQNRPDNKLYFDVWKAAGWYAVHDVSGSLKLDGEKEAQKIMERREAIRDRRFELQRAINLLGDLFSLGRLSKPEKKQEELNDLKESLKNASDFIRSTFPPCDLDPLDALAEKNKDPRWWKQEEDGSNECDGVCKIHRKWEIALGQQIHKWREEHKHFIRRIWDGTETRGIGGLSFWRLEELDAERRLTLCWSLHSRKYSAEEREDGTRKAVFMKSKARGVTSGSQNVEWVDTDTKLREHINKFKEDRRKVGANKIVMAALGYQFKARYGEGENKGEKKPKHEKWEKRSVGIRSNYILFENLSEYGFRKDRPRRENSKLMKWAHRAIPKEVKMQGQLFGLRVGDVLPQFTSRVYARNLSPGIRCHLVRAIDLKQGGYYHTKWQEEIDDQEHPRTKLPEPGDLVPEPLGEWFVTLVKDKNGDAKMCRVDADVNAAWNLQRRFWTHEFTGPFYRWDEVSKKRLFRDPSGIVVPHNMGADGWFSQEDFRAAVEKRILPFLGPGIREPICETDILEDSDGDLDYPEPPDDLNF